MSERIPPITEIIPSIYVGQLAIAQNKEILKRLGITHIVNLSQYPNYYPNDFTYLTIDIPDSPDADIAQHFTRSARFIHNAFLKQGKVLIHCFAGLSRSPTICISYLVKKRKMQLHKAIEFYTGKRPHVINYGFMRQLQRFLTEKSWTENKTGIITRSRIISKY
jgi:protein-tyrosine phosphatase